MASPVPLVFETVWVTWFGAANAAAPALILSDTLKATVTFQDRTDTFTVDERCVAYDREGVRRRAAEFYAVMYGEPTPRVTFEDETDSKPSEPYTAPLGPFYMVNW